MRRRLLALGAALAIVVAGLTACVGGVFPPAICVPELSVEPATAAPGETVTVSTERACPLEPPSGEWLVRVQPEGAPTPATEVRVDPAPDGSFSIAIDIPSDMPHGRAVAVIADWWDVAECPDGASCTSTAGYFSVEG